MDVARRSFLLVYKMGFLGYKRDSRVAIHHIGNDLYNLLKSDKKHIKKPIKFNSFEILEAAVRFCKLKRSGMKAILYKKGALMKTKKRSGKNGETILYMSAGGA